MPVALPTIIKEAEVSQRLLDFSATLTPPLGGASQRIARLGARFAVDVAMPTLEDTASRSWIANLLSGIAQALTFTLTWPQPTAASFGSPTVNGAGQAGTTLAVNNLTPSSSIPPLTFFSFSAGGRTYLHVTTAVGAVNGSGQVTLNIAPMLRASPANGAAVEMVSPTIEGFLDDGTVGWMLDRLRLRQPFRFTLTENE